MSVVSPLQPLRSASWSSAARAPVPGATSSGGRSACSPARRTTPPWTKLSDDGERATFFAGYRHIELHRTETTNYRDNLTNDEPSLWVVLRPSEADPPYALLTVTADPAEGEALTEAGNDLVETVPMPRAIQEVVAEFVAEHHVERPFSKRKRDRADPEALGRRAPLRDDEQP